MALADVLRERVSRRGRTAQVDCGELGTVTVEALPPRECSALGMADGGRALLYAACRELQAAGETLRRERRLFTPDEVTQYVADKEARTAARTVLALSGVTLNEDEADDGDETADQDGKADQEAEKPESPDKSGEMEHPDRTDEKTAENRLETVHETVQQISEIRPEIVQEQAASPTEPSAESANRLETVHKTMQQLPETQHEIRPGNVQFPDAAPADGQVSREFSGGSETVREIPSIGPDSDFEPQNLALSEKNGGFMSPLNLSGETEDFPAEQSAAHETKSEIRETVHEITSEIQPAAEMGLHEITSDFPETLHETTSEFSDKPPEALHETTSEVRETVHEIKSEFPENRRQRLHETMSEFGGKSLEALHETEADFQSAPHEIKSEIDENRRETLHETTSELAEQVAERLLEGLRRAAAVR